MSQFRFIKGTMEGLWVVEPRLHSDVRGSFMEIYHLQEFEEAGLSMKFVQDNESRSHKGVLRGLHFQKKLPQGKLVRVSQGGIYDVAVDIRPRSHSFGQWFGLVLNCENNRMLYIPPGFAHGFLSLSEGTCVQYKCSEYYHAEDQGGIRWNDPDINIKWPDIGIHEFILSDKDKALPSLRDKPVSVIFDRSVNDEF